MRKERPEKILAFVEGYICNFRGKERGRGEGGMLITMGRVRLKP